ncbi:hypothetical protein HDE_10783 [Halotydeus destructor]|nr:hypothetical protein HDE_10783 [Halotydeus destructor]
MEAIIVSLAAYDRHQRAVDEMLKEKAKTHYQPGNNSKPSNENRNRKQRYQPEAKTEQAQEQATGEVETAPKRQRKPGPLYCEQHGQCFHATADCNVLKARSVSKVEEPVVNKVENSAPGLYLSVSYADTRELALLDTGATVNLIDKVTADKFGLKIVPTSTIISSSLNTRDRAVGAALAKIRVSPGHSVTVKFIVMETTSDPVILGMPFYNTCEASLKFKYGAPRLYLRAWDTDGGWTKIRVKSLFHPTLPGETAAVMDGRNRPFKLANGKRLGAEKDPREPDFSTKVLVAATTCIGPRATTTVPVTFDYMGHNLPVTASTGRQDASLESALLQCPTSTPGRPTRP